MINHFYARKIVIAGILRQKALIYSYESKLCTSYKQIHPMHVH